jgi:hypothetical protein
VRLLHLALVARYLVGADQLTLSRWRRRWRSRRLSRSWAASISRSNLKDARVTRWISAQLLNENPHTRCIASAVTTRGSFEVILGGIDAGLGTGLILIAGGSADADRADLHLVRGHDR